MRVLHSLEVENMITTQRGDFAIPLNARGGKAALTEFCTGLNERSGSETYLRHKAQIG